MLHIIRHFKTIRVKHPYSVLANPAISSGGANSKALLNTLRLFKCLAFAFSGGFCSPGYKLQIFLGLNIKKFGNISYDADRLDQVC